MKLQAPNLRELIREKTGGPVAGVSRDEFRKLANEAMEEIATIEDKIAAGAFVCDVCDSIHYNWAPPACRAAHNSPHW